MGSLFNNIKRKKEVERDLHKYLSKRNSTFKLPKISFPTFGKGKPEVQSKRSLDAHQGRALVVPPAKVPLSEINYQEPPKTSHIDDVSIGESHPVSEEPKRGLFANFRTLFDWGRPTKNESEEHANFDEKLEIEHMDNPPEEPPEDHVHLDIPVPPKANFLDNLRERIHGVEEETPGEDYSTLVMQEMKSDMKDLAKHTITLLHQVHPRYLQKVKASEEFEQIKDIFRKHHIIK